MMFVNFSKYRNEAARFLIRSRKYFLIPAVIIVSFLLMTFIFRGQIASYYLQKKIDRFNQKYPAVLSFSHFRMRGLNTVLLRGISLKPYEGDTLVTVDSVSASFGIGKLLFGTLEISDLTVNDVVVRLTREDSIRTNYMFLLGRGGDTLADTASGRNYAAAVSRIFNTIFEKVPNSMDLSKFRLLIKNEGHLVGIILDEMSVRDHYFRGPVRIIENNRSDTMMISVLLDKHQHRAGFMIYSNKFQKVNVPFTTFRWNTSVQFDTLSFSMTGKETGEDSMSIYGYANLRGLLINNEKIAAEDILFEKLGLNYYFNFGRDYAEMDSSTVVTFNRTVFHPYIKYRPYPTKQITLKIHKPDLPAQDLFSSFPDGLFTTLDGIRVRGTLTYNLDFFVDLSQPDSLLFESEMKRKGFGVISFGKVPLTRINDPFLYTAYERDQPVRSFMVGPVNPDFRPVDHISPYLRLAVLTGEDPGFYQHAGFLMDAFRESIATNIKQKRFARGGSTITMQMVKNVFLSRNKTIGRKAEEMLITWLIETQRLSGKDRILEVYLNIIEWGPMIYGANEASQFYFGKDASKLTLSEAIFMASLVPHPKWWKSYVTSEGRLRPSMAEYYRLVSGKMLRKGLITQQEFDRISPDIELRGPARDLLPQNLQVSAASTDIPFENGD